MAAKAADQMTVVDLTDGYSVNLTNDSFTFAGDKDGKIAVQQQTTTVIQALRGDEEPEVSVNASAISKPSGVNVSYASNTKTLTITVTTSVTAGGIVSIPVVLDGDVTVNKIFSFAIAKTGATGETGAAGRGISSTVIAYQVGTSPTTPPTGTWSSSPVATTAEGQYLWTRTTTKYTSGSDTVSYSVAAHGSKGEQGQQGSAGRGISSTAIAYQVGTSATTPPTGTWSTSPVATTAQGQYLWTRTTTKYTSGSDTISYSVAAHGTKGDKGNKGDDAITMALTSSAGTIFKNSDIATVITAHVYKAGAEVTGTALSALGTISWKIDGSAAPAAKVSGTANNTLTISAGDVANKAVITAELN
ncbi:MAG: hypothetical protein SOR91_03840 [Hornefia butyriciproducens]|uniref:hypothetical protein n=1 Tax=Hornefia butyriciproducens TaxID=2652293 RepID=UPI002A751B65|nr:hypothetical protein [Hornefia butyriciproducens]MDY2990588.1 hypothetical protein [Hornefia butyriciproducens]